MFRYVLPWTHKKMWVRLGRFSYTLWRQAEGLNMLSDMGLSWSNDKPK
jgi:hypothetical protein